MGYIEYKPYEEMIERKGISKILDYIVGRKKIKRLRKVRIGGLPITTFNVLIEQLNEYYTERKKTMKGKKRAKTFR